MRVLRVMLILLTTLSVEDAVRADAYPTRYWPKFPVPVTILKSENINRMSFQEDVLVQTLAGLVAYSFRKHGTGEFLWLDNGTASYAEWLKREKAYTGCKLLEDRAYTTWELVDRYRQQGILKGYILYKKDPAKRPLYEGKPLNTSVNVANALCPILSGVAVEETLETDARTHGLKCLLDVREKDETWLWQEYGKKFSRDLIARQDPLNAIMRAEITAMGAMPVSECGPLYTEVLEACRAGSPVLGWGIGMEDEQTGPSSRFGLFQTATNWCANLQITSAGKTGLNYPFKPFPAPVSSPKPPAANDNTRYVSFILSDGDNVQWLMLNFCQGEEAQQYWAAPARGKIPFGWTTCAMDLLQLCPYTLDYLRETATPNDDFVLLGGGYYYPDWFGQARPEKNLLARQAHRTEKYVNKCGITGYMVNVQDWNSDVAIKAYETYTKEMPSINGIFVIQYAPYTGGHGAIRWVARADGSKIPVVTARNAIWAQRGQDPWEGSPTRVATMLNEWASKPIQKPEDRFAWVIVHAWSWFRQPSNDPASSEEVDQTKNYPGISDIARGYLPATWCAERLSPQIKLVTPPIFLNLLKATE